MCGSLTLDNVVTSEGALLPMRAAGNVVYAALGAALWGRSVGLVSRAGADFPADFLAMLADRGLDLGGIARIDAPHGMNVAFAYRPDGSRVRAFPADLVARIPLAERARYVDYTTLGPAHRYATWLGFAPDADDVPAAWDAAVRAVHLAAMPVQRLLSLARRLHRPTRHVQVDSPWYDERMPAQDFHTDLFGRIDLLLPSEADVATWRPSEPPLATAASLARNAGRPIILKQSEAGCVLIDAEGAPWCAIPSCPVAAIDPTGAGDAFCGGVLAGLSTGDLRHAAACGTVSASFAVQGAGLDGLLHATEPEARRRLGQLMPRTRNLRATEPS